jgi:hypothetical protein
VGVGSANHAPLLYLGDKGLLDLQGWRCAYELGYGKQKRTSEFNEGSSKLD